MEVLIFENTTKVFINNRFIKDLNLCITKVREKAIFKKLLHK